MHSDVLGDLARDALDAFFRQDGADGFALAGGTGLALGYLGHRVSVDLDLFAHEKRAFAVGPNAIEAAADACGATAVRRRASPAYVEYRLLRRQEELKIDVVLEPTEALAPALRFGSIRVESLLDLAVNKVCAIYHRGGGRGWEPKDYADLYCILTMTKLRLDTLLAHVPQKEGSFNPIFFASFLKAAEELSFSSLGWLKQVKDDEVHTRMAEEADRIFARYRPQDEQGGT